MSPKGTLIDHVIFDAGKGRFEADVIVNGKRRKHIHVSIPGNLHWGHRRTVNELVAAAERVV